MVQLATRDPISTKAIGYALGFAFLWAVLAAIRPGTTFHLAPPLVALAVPLVYRVQGGTSRSTGIRLAGGAVGLAVVTSVLLAAAGLLQGPSLLPFGGAFVESLVGVAVGGVLGVLVAGWPQPARAN